VKNGKTCIKNIIIILQKYKETIVLPGFLQTLPADLMTLLLRYKIQNGYFITKECSTLNTSQDLLLQITLSSLLLSVFHYLILYFFSLILCAPRSRRLSF